MLTGGVCTITHAALVILLAENRIYNIEMSNGIAYTISAALGLLMNTGWSFRKSFSIQLVQKYIGVSVVGLVVAISIAYLNRKYGNNYLIGVGLILCICPALTYWMHARITYK